MNSQNGTDNGGRSASFNPLQVVELARNNWYRQASAQLNLAQRLQMAIPVFFGIALLVFFALSAAHTASMVNKFVPPISIGGIVVPIGIIAPIGFELLMMAIAMLLYLAGRNNERVPRLWIVMEIVLFVLVLTGNVTGGLIEGQRSIELASAGKPPDPVLSISVVFSSIAFAFGISIGAYIIGQMLAHLVWQRQTGNDFMAAEWRRAAPGVLRQAFVMVIGKANPGMARAEISASAAWYAEQYDPTKDVTSKDLSRQVKKSGLLDKTLDNLDNPIRPEHAIALAAVKPAVTPFRRVGQKSGHESGQPDSGQSGQTDAFVGQRSGQLTPARGIDVKRVSTVMINRWLDAHPEALSMTLDKAWNTIKRDHPNTARSTFHSAWQARRDTFPQS